MSDVPLASFEDPRWFPANKNRVGNRGYSGTLASFTTNLTNTTDNDLVITAKDCEYSSDPVLKVQYALLVHGAPGWLYEDGYPAIFTPKTDLGFKIIMKRAGSWGNYVTLTLVNPGILSPLSIRRPAMNDIVITLAHSATLVTTTPALLIAAINGDPELSEYMLAFASTSTTTALIAVPQQLFASGSEVPGLVLVSLASSNAGVISTTGAKAKVLLNGSRYVTAAYKGSDNGTGLVAAMAVSPLTGGTANRGEVSDQYLTRRDAQKQRVAPGIPLGKEQNKTLQARSSRFGAIRTYKRVPRQDRAIIASSAYNYQTAQWPSSLLVAPDTTVVTTTTAAPTTTTTSAPSPPPPPP